jgi:arylsulfatase
LFVVRTTAPTGVIVAQGGSFGGWSLYAVEGRLRYCHNLAGLRQFVVRGTEPIPAGRHQVRMEFSADGRALGTGGTVRLFVDGRPGGEGRLEATVPMIYSGDETLDVGSDLGTPVSDDYPAESNGFTGRVSWVQLDVDPHDTDHLIDPQERLRVILARQ